MFYLVIYFFILLIFLNYLRKINFLYYFGYFYLSSTYIFLCELMNSLCWMSLNSKNEQLNLLIIFSEFHEMTLLSKFLWNFIIIIIIMRVIIAQKQLAFLFAKLRLIIWESKKKKEVNLSSGRNSSLVPLK